jgi:hypothetical protein
LIGGTFARIADRCTQVSMSTVRVVTALCP